MCVCHICCQDEQTELVMQTRARSQFSRTSCSTVNFEEGGMVEGNQILGFCSRNAKTLIYKCNFGVIKF